MLDPACGEGELLAAIARIAPPRIQKLTLVGVDRDDAVVDRARAALGALGLHVELMVGDFLEVASVDQLALSDDVQRLDLEPERGFDVVVSNPPYVRTQVLGARTAQVLAERFQLSGRVDLYQAFVRAMAPSLRIGGVLGLLCSNRFLSVQAGASLRGFLSRQLELREIFDLGDTKLFRAAVLPAIVIARQSSGRATGSCAFTRVYECENSSPDSEEGRLHRQCPGRRVGGSRRCGGSLLRD